MDFQRTAAAAPGRGRGAELAMRHQPGVPRRFRGNTPDAIHAADANGCGSRRCFRGNTSAAGGEQSTGGAQRLAAFNAARDLSIDAHTARSRWGGERMDYNIAIDALRREAEYR